MVRSMYSGVSGMKAHQARMDVIGNNISNVNTYGFKASRASFRDTYYQTLSKSSGATNNAGGRNATQIGYGSQLGSIDIDQSQSSFTMTGNGMDLAIAGDGFFQVQDPDGNIFYTRSGMLNIDPAGNLVDMNGNFVLGISGNPVGKAPSNERIQLMVPNANPAAAAQTMQINGVTYTLSASNETKDGNVTFNFSSANMADGMLAEAKVTTSGISVILNNQHKFQSMGEITDAINEAITAANGGKPHPAGKFNLSADPEPTFPAGGISGADIASSNFSPTNGTIQFASGQTMHGFDFNSKYAVGSEFKGDTTGLTGTPPASMTVTQNAGTPNTYTVTMTVGTETYTLDIDESKDKPGSMKLMGSSGDPNDYIVVGRPAFKTLEDIDWAAQATPGEFTLGIDKVTPTVKSDAWGLSSKPIRLEGGTAGGEQTMADLTSIGIGPDGVIEAIHPQLGLVQLGQICLATFDNPQGLVQVGNSYFSESANSGGMYHKVPGTEGSGALAGGSLEMSNVDLSKEFADMIVTQRGFQANSRLISVSDEMLNELVNLRR